LRAVVLRESFFILIPSAGGLLATRRSRPLVYTIGAANKSIAADATQFALPVLTVWHNLGARPKARLSGNLPLNEEALWTD
jgi:hypothetical protein